MEEYTGTDLASESLAEGEDLPAGIRRSEHQSGGFTVQTIRVCNRSAAEQIGKPIGTYLTLDCGRTDRLDADGRERLAHVLSGELRGLCEAACGKRPDPELNLLIVGLGNASLTADAIGPLTVRRLTATAHLRACDPDLYRKLGCCSVSILAAGVLGQSGIEAGTLVKTVVREISPDAVLAIDALAARDLERLASTVQLSDAGIVPGSGVGNRRSELTRDALGVPVLALGIPTVVGSSTLVWDALARAGIREPSPELRDVLNNGKDFFVSLKESDAVTEQTCAIFARAVSLAFLGGIEA